ncbi:uncharacterized protein LOC117610527 isoform X1 [Osmia lignaria lignaria]|uniref:uncharacterized protein LOC117610527 isoform X1 n=1 Tax=Osmia lignaria lignaria TaxID=1437193 RepID=UPI00402B2488
MAIDASFHKNVFLLMQLVPPSYECIKHFKKGMFDKPNTSGFIHISHYLLSVYNAKHFQKMVVWPLMNKMDERKYRMEVKAYLEIVANENPDINFPSILMSHLLLAGGTKFLIIMWKISEVSLRAYITNKCQMKVLQAPSIGNNKNIVQLYFTTINLKKNIAISKYNEKEKLIAENFKHYMECKSNDLTKMQNNIFETKENLMKLVPSLPINPIIATSLIDTEDTDIINLWKRNINEKLKYLHTINCNLNKLKTSSRTLGVLSLSTNCESFDGNDLPKVQNEIIPLCFANNRQQLNYGLYMNGSLVFHIFLSILNHVLKRLYFYLKMNYLSDLSDCEPKIIEHCQIIKFHEIKFQKLIIQISDILCNAQCSLQERSLNCTFETDILFPMNFEKLLTSPKFNIFINDDVDDDKLFKTLCFSPLQGTYKHLFKRYRRLFNSSKGSGIKLQFDDSIENIAINWKSPQRLSLSNKLQSPNKLKISPRYSRLFSPTDSRKNYFKDNNAASTPKQSRIHTTPKKFKIQTTSPEININSTMKSIFDLSCKIRKVVASLSKS